MKDDVYSKINSLIDRRNTRELILSAITELKFCKNSIWQYVIAAVLGIITSVIVGFSYKTIEIMLELSELLFNTAIAVIGIVLGAYAIFQALLQNELILLLIESKNNILKTSNITFFNIVILYVADALISLMVKIILSTLNGNELLFDSLFWNNVGASTLIFIYLFLNFLLLLELIVFTVNLYRMFCMHNAVKALEIIEEEKNSNEDNEA